MALLEIRELTVTFQTTRGTFTAVDGIELDIEEGDILGAVGESGSGKSVSMLALMGLLPWTATVSAKRMLFAGLDMLSLSARGRRRFIGKDMAMIFQEPMTSLNPCFTAGFQIMETLRIHEGGSRAERRRRAVDLLHRVGIADGETRLEAFPHQLSGGMNQRVMVAMAIACNPRLLIADEPKTALDVTIQAQILDLLRALQQERGMALVLITHDMGVVAEMAHRVQVTYASQQMEMQSADRIFDQPMHPYTSALLDALPERSVGRRRLPMIPGVVPGQGDRIVGCLFHPRCQFAAESCRTEQPRLRDYHGGSVRCHFPLEAAAT